MKTALLIIIYCGALAATAGPTEPAAHNHPAVSTVPAAHIVAKPISRAPLPPVRVSTVPKRGTATPGIGGSMLANSKGAAAVNGTGIRNQGGKK